MSVKKYFGLTAVGIASLAATSAMAGGPDMAPAPDYSGFYIDGDVGWAGSDWQDFVGGIFNPTGGAASSGTVEGGGYGGFAWGGDIGYQFNEYYSFEVGAYSLRSVAGNVGNANRNVASPGTTFQPPNPSAGPAKVSSWIAYAAGKLTIPLFDNVDLFGKAGIAWRFLDYSGTALGQSAVSLSLAATQSFSNTHYATALAGVGLQYWITPEWSVNAQYLYVPGRSADQEIDQQAPSVHLVVGGVGYKFTT